jgi:predicted amidohydrolase
MLQVASRHYAFEGRCFVLAAGSLLRAKNLPAELEPHPDKVKSPEQLVMRGGSAIIGPDGQYLAGPVYDEPVILRAELPLDRIREEGMALDVAGHYARRDCFSFEVGGTARTA